MFEYSESNTGIIQEKEKGVPMGPDSFGIGNVGSYIGVSTGQSWSNYS